MTTTTTTTVYRVFERGDRDTRRRWRAHVPRIVMSRRVRKSRARRNRVDAKVTRVEVYPRLPTFSVTRLRRFRGPSSAKTGVGPKVADSFVSLSALWVFESKTFGRLMSRKIKWFFSLLS